jgi:membrane-associated phospholipid phosphatase
VPAHEGRGILHHREDEKQDTLDMADYLGLADARILLWLNHALAAHPKLYLVGLFLTDKGSDIAVGLTALVLWFWPYRFRSFLEKEPEARASVADARRASRGRLIAFGVGGMAAYVVARLTAVEMDRPRPFATYLPVEGVPGAFEGLRTFGTFPSDHAALLGAVPVGFACWSTGLGLAWAVAAVALMAVRVAVGFHYPLDMLAGGLIGIVCVAAAMAAYDRRRRLYTLSSRLADGFARPPQAYVLYALLGLGALEFAAHFKHLLGVILWLRVNLLG